MGKFYPYKEGGGGQTGFGIAERGHNKFWCSFNIEVLAMLKGEGWKDVSSL